MISVKNITKKFGPVTAVAGISFTLGKGELVGFLGPNGAGKTTTMRILTGYLPPDSGSCTIGGLDVSTHGIDVKKMIGYLPESAPLYGEMEVTDYLAYIGRLRRLSLSQIEEGIRKVVATCGLKKAAGRKIGTLSKGFRQRVALAQSLIHEPDVLILDEPTVGLDPNQIGEIRELIAKIGKEKTVLLSTHILSEVEQTCKKVIIISDGKIAGEGTPAELSSRIHGRPVWQVRVRGEKEEIARQLGAMPGAEGVAPIGSENGHHRFRISLAQPEGGEEIFKLAAARNWILSELKKEEVGLEGVFKKLTA